MPFDLDSSFGVHAKALGVASQRLQLLADNLANADTPNYKARDLDFKAALSNAETQSVQMAATRNGHIGLPANANRAEVLYRVPDQPSQDGNTVDTQKESSAVAETAVRYQATLTFLNARIRGIRLAITGGR
jgi:flagellar basal-body rod protein FlgB